MTDKKRNASGGHFEKFEKSSYNIFSVKSGNSEISLHTAALAQWSEINSAIQ